MKFPWIISQRPHATKRTPKPEPILEEVLFPAPQGGPQHPASVKRKGRQEIEQGQDEIHPDEVEQDAVDSQGPAGRLRDLENAVKDDCNEHAGDGSDNGREKLGLRAGRLFTHLGHPAENEKGDPPHGNAKLPCHQRVAEFVKDDGKKKPQGSGCAHGPVIRRRHVLKVGGKDTFGQ